MILWGWESFSERLSLGFLHLHPPRIQRRGWTKQQVVQKRKFGRGIYSSSTAPDELEGAINSRLNVSTTVDPDTVVSSNIVFFSPFVWE